MNGILDRFVEWWFGWCAAGGTGPFGWPLRLAYSVTILCCAGVVLDLRIAGALFRALGVAIP